MSATPVASRFIGAGWLALMMRNGLGGESVGDGRPCAGRPDRDRGRYRKFQGVVCWPIASASRSTTPTRCLVIFLIRCGKCRRKESALMPFNRAASATVILRRNSSAVSFPDLGFASVVHGDPPQRHATVCNGGCPRSVLSNNGDLVSEHCYLLSRKRRFTIKGAIKRYQRRYEAREGRDRASKSRWRATRASPATR